jgi:hypothetical protein
LHVLAFRVEFVAENFRGVLGRVVPRWAFYVEVAIEVVNM